MFVTDQIISVNTKEKLRPGKYKADCTAFFCQKSARIFYLYGYVLDGAEEVSCVDMVIVDPDGATSVVDFLHYPDGQWRDSYGEVAISLAELLPSELKDSMLIQVFELDDRIVGK